MNRKELTVSWLTISASLLFIGRGIQHIFWDAPFRTFFWDEALLKPVVEGLFRVNWHYYVTSPVMDSWINGMVTGTGVLYIMAAIAVFFLKADQPYKYVAKGIVLFSGVGLFILAVLYSKEKFFQLGQLLEYSAQVGTPFLLLYMTQKERKFPVLVAKGLVALTFVCHGLYAVGFYPLPGSFVDMTIQTLHVTEGQAKVFLHIAGVLDFVVAIGIFVPRVAQTMLLYMAFWGGVTSLARITGHFQEAFLFDTISYWCPQMLLRVPHALLPLTLYWHLKQSVDIKTGKVEMA
ncbi:hypothetical protein [Algivirga pacifica]|uniref:Uncharacterized protein n=1 Tax=Algivirga pacifica TaxID=1162670 RepID=A0ABP9D990_9BACT